MAKKEFTEITLGDIKNAGGFRSGADIVRNSQAFSEFSKSVERRDYGDVRRKMKGWVTNHIGFVLKGAPENERQKARRYGLLAFISAIGVAFSENLPELDEESQNAIEIMRAAFESNKPALPKEIIAPCVEAVGYTAERMYGIDMAEAVNALNDSMEGSMDFNSMACFRLRPDYFVQNLTYAMFILEHVQYKEICDDLDSMNCDFTYDTELSKMRKLHKDILKKSGNSANYVYAPTKCPGLTVRPRVEEEETREKFMRVCHKLAEEISSKKKEFFSSHLVYFNNSETQRGADDECVTALINAISAQMSYLNDVDTRSAALSGKAEGMNMSERRLKQVCEIYLYLDGSSRAMLGDELRKVTSKYRFAVRTPISDIGLIDDRVFLSENGIEAKQFLKVAFPRTINPQDGNVLTLSAIVRACNKCYNKYQGQMLLNGFIQYLAGYERQEDLDLTNKFSIILLWILYRFYVYETLTFSYKPKIAETILQYNYYGMDILSSDYHPTLSLDTASHIEHTVDLAESKPSRENIIHGASELCDALRGLQFLGFQSSVDNMVLLSSQGKVVSMPDSNKKEINLLLNLNSYLGNKYDIADRGMGDSDYLDDTKYEFLKGMLAVGRSYKIMVILDNEVNANLIPTAAETFVKEIENEKIYDLSRLDIKSAAKKLRKKLIEDKNNEEKRKEDAIKAERAAKVAAEQERANQIRAMEEIAMAEKKRLEDIALEQKRKDEEARQELERQAAEEKRRAEEAEKQRLAEEDRKREEEELAEIAAFVAEDDARKAREEKERKAAEAAEKKRLAEEAAATRRAKTIEALAYEANYIRQLLGSSSAYGYVGNTVEDKRTELSQLNNELFNVVNSGKIKAFRDVRDASGELYPRTDNGEIQFPENCVLLSISEILSIPLCKEHPDEINSYKLKKVMSPDEINWERVKITEAVEDFLYEFLRRHKSEIHDPLDGERMKSKKKLCEKHGVTVEHYERAQKKFAKAEKEVGDKYKFADNLALSLSGYDLDKVALMYHASKVRYNFDGTYTVISHSNDMLIVDYETVVKVLALSQTKLKRTRKSTKSKE